MLQVYDSEEDSAIRMPSENFLVSKSNADTVDGILINQRLLRHTLRRARTDIKHVENGHVGKSLSSIADMESMNVSLNLFGVHSHDSSPSTKGYEQKQQRSCSPTIHASESASKVENVKVSGLGPIIVRPMISAGAMEQNCLTSISTRDVIDRPSRIKTSLRQVSTRSVSPEAIRAVSSLPRKMIQGGENMAK